MNGLAACGQNQGKDEVGFSSALKDESCCINLQQRFKNPTIPSELHSPQFLAELLCHRVTRREMICDVPWPRWNTDVSCCLVECVAYFIHLCPEHFFKSSPSGIQEDSREGSSRFTSAEVITQIHVPPIFPPEHRVLLFAPEFGTDQSFDVASWWHVGARQEGTHAHMKTCPSL